MEIGYPCRLRGIETTTLTDENELEEGMLTNRRKGNREYRAMDAQVTSSMGCGESRQSCDLSKAQSW